MDSLCILMFVKSVYEIFFSPCVRGYYINSRREVLVEVVKETAK